MRFHHIRSSVLSAAVQYAFFYLRLSAAPVGSTGQAMKNLRLPRAGRSLDRRNNSNATDPTYTIRPTRSFSIIQSVKAGALYFVCAILWFGLLENLSKALTKSPERQALYKGLTGLSFVIGSAIAVSFLVYREFARHQRVETTVCDSEERLRAVLETAVEGIITIGERGQIEAMNRAALKMFGYEDQDLLGQNVRVLNPVPVAVVRQAFDIDIPRTLHFIEAGVVKIDSLLKGFLRYSRIGRVVINVQIIDMNALVDGLAQALKFQMEEARAQWKMEDLPPCLGDVSHLGPVFSNLLDNAVKYRDPARPLEIKVTGTVDRGRAIYAVSDNGIGISPEHRGKIFEIFHRLNPGTLDGEGLALTIAQRILERQNGKIWVEGQPGIGSTFFVSLPHKTQTV